MKEKKYLILGIAIVLITLIGVTYAYFTTRIIGDRKNVTVDMAELKIIFTNGDAIEASDVYYYSGNTTNNWVKFGKYTNNGPVRGYDSSESLFYQEYSTIDECSSASSYNIDCKYAWNTGDDMYWRIIRTNEDGSIRMLYRNISI